MEHSNKQVFLFGIGEEFDVTLTAMVADHGKAGTFYSWPIICDNIDKAPVHLVRFARLGAEAPPPVSLWRDLLPFWRQQMFMSKDIIFDYGYATRVSLTL
jgi:hypothetical protein